MRHPRILNRAAQADQPKALEEGAVPSQDPACCQTRPRALDEQPAESSYDILVEVREMVGRIPGAKVLRPAAEHWIEVRNDDAEVRVTPPTGREVSHTGAHPRHRTR